MFSSLILALSPLSVFAQQTLNNGSCNIQLKGDKNTASITCILAQNLPLFPSLPSSNVVNLLAQVKGLQRNSNSFTWFFDNLNSNQILNIPTRMLTVVDDLGNTYELDRWAMFGIDLSKKVPPNSKVKLQYVLETPINPNASHITFIVSNIWTQPIQSPFSRPVPLILWKVQL